MTIGVDAAVRSILLPVQPGTGPEYAQRAEEILTALAVTEEPADWIVSQTKQWERTNKPTPIFRSFIEQLIYNQNLEPPTFALPTTDNVAPGLPKAFASKYFLIHQQIMNEEKCDHVTARRIMSHAHSVFLCATEGRMTAARIFSMMTADGVYMGRSWRTTRSLLDKCGLSQLVPSGEVERLYKAEAISEGDLLGDLDLDESVNFVSLVCTQLGYSKDITSELRTLFLTDVHPPYLCMLHFQLTIQAFYNHRLTNAYEFEPRGEQVLWLARQYNSSGLTVLKSPFLNNAKSVDALNSEWASSKKTRERQAARALADLLGELDCLSDPSRVAAGQYLRALLLRKLRISKQRGKALTRSLPQLDSKSASSLLLGVGRGNTGTRGVIEQRLMDCIALNEAGDLDQWWKRGFGDSVFTTNTSQRKFGDAELKHVSDPRIVAFESHGGRLTERYVRDHLDTIENVLPYRAAELEDRFPLSNWKLEVCFLAHELDAGMIRRSNIGGLDVAIS